MRDRFHGTPLASVGRRKEKKKARGKLFRFGQGRCRRRPGCAAAVLLSIACTRTRQATGVKPLGRAKGRVERVPKGG